MKFKIIGTDGHCFPVGEIVTRTDRPALGDRGNMVGFPRGVGWEGAYAYNNGFDFQWVKAKDIKALGTFGRKQSKLRRLDD